MVNDIDPDKLYSYTIDLKAPEGVDADVASSNDAVSNGERLKKYLEMEDLEVRNVTALVPVDELEPLADEFQEKADYFYKLYQEAGMAEVGQITQMELCAGRLRSLIQEYRGDEDV